MTLRAYAERIGVDEKTVYTWKNAAEVAVLTGQNFEVVGIFLGDSGCAQLKFRA